MRLFIRAALALAAAAAAFICWRVYRESDVSLFRRFSGGDKYLDTFGNPRSRKEDRNGQ